MGRKLESRRNAEAKKTDSEKVKPRKGSAVIRAAAFSITLPFLAAGLVGCKADEKDRQEQVDNFHSGIGKKTSEQIMSKEEIKALNQKEKNEKLKEEVQNQEDVLMVYALLRAGAEVDGDVLWNASRLASTEDGYKILGYVMENGGEKLVKTADGKEALMVAIRVGNSSAVQLLLDSGVELTAEEIDIVTKKHKTAENKEIIEILKKAKAKGKLEAELWNAVKESDLDKAKELLEQGVNPNTVQPGNDMNFNILMLAAHENDLEMIKMLVEHGADVNSRDSYEQSVLMYCLHSPEIVDYLIKKGADVDTRDRYGYTALMQAVTEHKPEYKTSVKLLVEAGADVNAENKRGEVILELTYDKEIMEFLRQNGAKELSPEQEKRKACRDFNDAVFYRDLDRMKELIDKVDVNKAYSEYSLENPISVASEYGKMEIVMFLLDNGAEVTGLAFDNAARTARDKEGVKVFKLLMKHGGGELIKNHGASVLDTAAYNGNMEIAKILIFEGVDPNEKDEVGNVPLISAISGGADIEMVKFLVNNGADVNAVDGKGESALENAYIWGDSELVKYLLNNGAKK